jgi:hypothetical protein
MHKHVARIFGNKLNWRNITASIFYGVALVVVFRAIDAGSHSGSDTLIGFFVPFVSISVIFILILRILR